MNMSEEDEAAPCRFIKATDSLLVDIHSDELFVNQIIVLSINGMLLIPTITLNAISIVTILNSSQMKNRPCYYIILVQSVIDLVVGVFGLPVFLVFLAAGLTGDINCFALVALKSTILPISTSTITLSALTMDRYIAIVHPFHYVTHVTNRRVRNYVAVGFFLMLGVLVMSFVIEGLLDIVGTTLVVLVFVFITLSYTKIFLVVRKLSNAQIPPSERNVQKQKMFLKEIKQAKSCFAVVVCFFLLSFFAPVWAVPFEYNKDTKYAINIWKYTLAMSNSSFNSVIFFWAKRMLRKEALVISYIALFAIFKKKNV